MYLIITVLPLTFKQLEVSNRTDTFFSYYKFTPFLYSDRLYAESGIIEWEIIVYKPTQGEHANHYIPDQKNVKKTKKPKTISDFVNEIHMIILFSDNFWSNILANLAIYFFHLWLKWPNLYISNIYHEMK